MTPADGPDEPSPARLLSARLIRGLTQSQLAEALGVTKQLVSLFEKGERRPHDYTCRYALALNFPEKYFYARELEPLPSDLVTFRSRRSMTATLRDRTIEKARHASDLISPLIHNRFKLPNLDIPDQSQEKPEAAARLLREYWRMGQGPVANIVHLLETNGAEVYWLSEDSSSVDALSFWRQGTPFVLLNTFKDSGERARFDAAHELGHLVLHRSELALGQAEEREADQFASAFLMPKEQFSAESHGLRTLDQLKALKSRWGTSVQAMVRRLKDIEVFGEWAYESAFREISARGWRTREPNGLPRENSHLHQQMFERLARNGLGPRSIASETNLPLGDLLELMPSAVGYANLPGEEIVTGCFPINLN